MNPVLVLCFLQVSKASHYSQPSGQPGDTIKTCGPDELRKGKTLSVSWLVFPQIKIRRDSNLFMQETPVLALRV